MNNEVIFMQNIVCTITVSHILGLTGYWYVLFKKVNVRIPHYWLIIIRRYTIVKFRPVNCISNLDDFLFFCMERFNNNTFALEQLLFAFIGAKGDWDFRIIDLVKNPD